VTGQAIDTHVRTRQRKTSLVVVKRRRLPGSRGVTVLTGYGEAAGRMVGVGGTLKVSLVAGIAVCLCIGEAVNMTLTAIQRSVRAGERERRRVIVGVVCPGAESGPMTELAVVLEGRQAVVGIGHGGSIFSMAGDTLCRCAGELITITALVTCFAVSDGVDAGQGEAQLGVFHQHVLARLPVLRRVTGSTVGAELTEVMIGMTVGAGGADMAENEILMTGRAIDPLMRSVEPKSSLVMIEFHVAAQAVP